jgi:hypothetical protein
VSDVLFEPPPAQSAGFGSPIAYFGIRSRASPYPPPRWEEQMASILRGGGGVVQRTVDDGMASDTASVWPCRILRPASHPSTGTASPAASNRPMPIEIAQFYKLP